MKKSLLLMLTISIIFLLSMSSLVVADDVAEIAARYDLGGDTVKILGQSEITGFDDGEGLAWKEEVEEMFNCKIELDHVHWSEINEHIRSAIMAGEKPADIMSMQFRFVHRFGTLYDFLLPLNDVIEDEYYERLPDFGLVDPENYKVAGVQYGVPRPGGAGRSLYWNKTMFEREGMPNLYELADNREWTWDKMLEIAQALTKDTNGDGLIDQRGMAPWFFHQERPVGDEYPEGAFRHTTPMIEHEAIWHRANDAPPIEFRDGRMVFVGDEPKQIEVLEYFADPDTNVPDGYLEDYPTNETQAFEDGDVGMIINSPSSSEMEDEWGLVPIPMGPSADEYHPVTGVYSTFFVPITVPNERARAVIEIATALFETAEPYIDTEEYVEEYWEEWAIDNEVHDQETVDWARWIMNNTKGDSEASIFRMAGSLHGGWGEDDPDAGMIHEMFRAAHGLVDAQSAMDSIKPGMQELLDDIFDQ